MIGEAANKARECGATTVRIEGRASTAGSPAANQALTDVRTQVVFDQLQRDGVEPTIIQPPPLGQTTATDISLMKRRVDIVLLR